jgi:hypothetical protein
MFNVGNRMVDGNRTGSCLQTINLMMFNIGNRMVDGNSRMMDHRFDADKLNPKSKIQNPKRRMISWQIATWWQSFMTTAIFQ